MHWTPEMLYRTRKLAEAGSGVRHIMGELGVGRGALKRVLSRHSIKTRYRGNPALGWAGEPAHEPTATLEDCEELPDA